MDTGSAAATTPQDRYSLVGHTLDGRIDVRRCVAEGGYGVVYEARHVTLDIPVALKVLKVPAELSPGARAVFQSRFAQEARTIAKLQHPAVVRVLDHGASVMPDGGTAPWMVLEWIDGRTLDALLKSGLSSDERRPARVLELLRPVLEALGEAHAAGISHRDVKPGNVMVTRGGRGPSLRLMDFGIAKESPGEEPSAGVTATRSDYLTFSPAFAAPEQVSGARTGPWTDVHAAALMITYALTGRVPYAATEITELYLQVLATTRPTPARFGVDVGPWERVLQRALSLRPDDRPRTALALLAELEAALPGEGDTMRPTVRPSTVTAAPPRGIHLGALAALVASAMLIVGWRVATRASSTQPRATVPAAQVARAGEGPAGGAAALLPERSAPIEALTRVAPGARVDAGFEVPAARPSARPATRRREPRPERLPGENVPVE